MHGLLVGAAAALQVLQLAKKGMLREVIAYAARSTCLITGQLAQRHHGCIAVEACSLPTKIGV